MRNHTVEISDRAGHAFKMATSTVQYLGAFKDYLAGDNKSLNVAMTGIENMPAKAKTWGQSGRVGGVPQVPRSWRTIDKSFLRYSSGPLLVRNSGNGDLTTMDLILMNVDQTWGMQLWEYEDAMGVNDQGQGAVNLPWVLGFPPGEFSWVKVD